MKIFFSLYLDVCSVCCFCFVHFSLNNNKRGLSSGGTGKQQQTQQKNNTLVSAATKKLRKGVCLGEGRTLGRMYIVHWRSKNGTRRLGRQRMRIHLFHANGIRYLSMDSGDRKRRRCNNDKRALECNRLAVAIAFFLEGRRGCSFVSVLPGVVGRLVKKHVNHENKSTKFGNT